MRLTARLALSVSALLAAVTSVWAQTSSDSVAWRVDAQLQSMALPSSAQGKTAPLQRIVSLNLDSVRLETALDEIDRQAGIVLEYTPRVVPVNRRVTVHLDSVTVARALEAVLAGTGVHAVVSASDHVMLVTQAAVPDTGFGTITGRVTDSLTRRGVARASVTVLDSSRETEQKALTGDSGFFGIDRVPAGTHRVSFVHRTRELKSITITVKPDQRSTASVRFD